MKRTYAKKSHPSEVTMAPPIPEVLPPVPPDPTPSLPAIYTVPSTQMSCFICNTVYWTIVHDSGTPLSTTRISTFCDLHGVTDTERQNMLRLSCLNDPFCVGCSQKVNQIQEWVAQLELLTKAIDNLKADISVLMVDSLLNSPNIEGTHYIKEKLVQVWNASIASAAIKDDKTTVTFQDLVRVEPLTEEAEVEGRKGQEAFEPHEVVLDDGFFNGEGESEVHEFEQGNVNVNPEENPDMTQPAKKSKRERSARTSRAETIPAHPDGRCRLCPSTFKSQMQLSKHIRRSHSGIVHPCRFCDKTFQDTSNRKRHEISVHVNQTRDFVCDQCGKSYKTPWMLRTHIKQSHEGVVFKQTRKIPSQCDLCGRVCTNLKNLRTHVRTNHTERNIKCSICARPFKDYQRQRKHEKTHLSDWELKEREGKTHYYKCSLCPTEGQIGFKAKTALLDHYVTEHPDDKDAVDVRHIPTKPPKHRPKFFCKECPKLKGFTRKTALQYHITHQHGDNLRLYNKFGKECQICQKPCRDATTAVLHQSTHCPRAYVCHLCLFTATIHREIVNHYSNAHPEEDKLPKFETLLNPRLKKFFCPQCPNHSGFVKKVQMRQHIQARHSRRKPILENYESPEDESEVENSGEGSESEELNRSLLKRFGKECRICQRPCRDATMAILHQATHFPKAHVCHLCPYSTSITREMTVHYSNTHPDQEIPKVPPFLRKLTKRFYCPLCPDHAGFVGKDKMRKHIMVRHTKKYKDTVADYDSNEETVESDEMDVEETKHEQEQKPCKKEIQFSKRGRELKPSRKLELSLESKKKLVVEIDRVDRKWPKGKIHRVTPLWTEVDLDTEVKFEQDPYLISVGHMSEEDVEIMKLEGDESN